MRRQEGRGKGSHFQSHNPPTPYLTNPTLTTPHFPSRAQLVILFSDQIPFFFSFFFIILIISINSIQVDSKQIKKNLFLFIRKKIIKVFKGKLSKNYPPL